MGQLFDHALFLAAVGTQMALFGFGHDPFEVALFGLEVRGRVYGSIGGIGNHQLPAGEAKGAEDLKGLAEKAIVEESLVEVDEAEVAGAVQVVLVACFADFVGGADSLVRPPWPHRGGRRVGAPSSGTTPTL